MALLPCPPIYEMSHHPKNGESRTDGLAAERLKAAAEILEMASANRALLAELSVEERKRLLKAAGDIYCPDVSARRRLVKARIRQRKADQLERDQSKLNE